MKILALTTNINRPSTRYRLLQYIPYFSNKGIIIDIGVIKNRFKRWYYLTKALKYDAVLIQKKLLRGVELKYLSLGKKYLIYDYDDAVMCVGSKRRLFQRMADSADLLLAGNRYLMEQVGSKNLHKVKIVPTAVKVSEYPLKGDEKSNKVIIGWIGTKSTIQYLKWIIPVLDDLTKKYPHIKLKIVSDISLDDKREYISFDRWEKDNEIEQLHSFDIGIMPLPDDLWTRGKCGFKLIQYMSVGIPAICSPVGVNTEIVEHGVNGFLAAAEKDWKKYLGILIEDKGLRKSMGLAGRRTVEKKYNLDYWSGYMAEKFSGLINGGRKK